MLPGMIDAHVHVFPRDENASQRSADARRRGQRADGSRRRLHDRPRHGLARRLRHGRPARRHQQRLVQGPRMQVAGPSHQPARQRTHLRARPVRLLSRRSPRTRTSTRRGSAAPRSARRSCTASTGSRSTRRRISSAPSTASSSPTARWSPVRRSRWKKSQAIVDEAHRLGLKVACHTYGGEGSAAA